MLSVEFKQEKSTSSQNEKVSPALTDAISNGDLRLCQQLVERGFNIGGTCECGCTVLLKACLKNQWAIASYVLQLGAPVKGVACAKESSFEGLTAFQLVTLNGELELFEKLFNQGPLTTEEKTQAFYLASKRGSVHILRFLLDHAEDRRTLLEAGPQSFRNQYLYRGEHGYIRPLHHVVHTGNVEAAEMLLRAGADLEARDHAGCTALHIANIASSNRPMVILLIKAGANLNTRNFTGMTPLMYAARRQHGLKNVKLLMSFAKGGLDLQATDRGGATALWHAIEGMNLDAATFLIKAGLDPLQRVDFGCSPIQRALHLSSTEFTLEILPDFDKIRSPTQGSILNMAALMGNEVVVTELLKRVPKKDQVEYVNLSCDFGTTLYCAAYQMGISIIEKLLENGAQVNLVGGPAGSPLMAACANGHVEAVRILLQKGAELQCTKFDGTTITAEEAAQHHESVLLLLRRYKEKGAHALDEHIPAKTADIPELDKFMVVYKEWNEKRLRQRGFDGKDQGKLLGDESDDWMETTNSSVHDEDDQEDDLEEQVELSGEESDDWMETINGSVLDEDDQEDDLEEQERADEEGREGNIETMEDDAKLKIGVEMAETA
jgi:ankyrin repeat protein